MRISQEQEDDIDQVWDRAIAAGHISGSGVPYPRGGPPGQPTITGVTALYDIGRDRFHHTRTIDRYVSWLNATLRAPLPFVVFLDPKIDASRINLKPIDRSLAIGIDDFGVFARRKQVEEVLKQRQWAKCDEDITFLHPPYSMLMLSKLEIMARTATMTATDGLFWIDAGLSRFFSQELQSTEISASFLEAIGNASFAAAITPLLASDLWRGGPSCHYPGTAARLVTGGDFYVRADQAQALSVRLLALIDGWLAQGLWDNEQVALGCMLLEGIDNAKILSVTEEYAVAFERLLSFPTRGMPDPVHWFD
jgi:hypothetical protein